MTSEGVSGIRRFELLFIILFFGICAAPAAGMAVGGGVQKGDAQLEENLAFRDELVTLNALWKSCLFGVSSDDGVIDGKNGWLYYSDTRNDYLGIDLLCGRELYNIARSLALMQEYAQEKGMKFLYVPVPNKNTVYGQNMPYYFNCRVENTGNLEHLFPYLDRENVSYVNLIELFLEQESVLYHRTDSHWTNQGAAYASEWIQSALGNHFHSYVGESYTVRKDFTGDLEKMLYPAMPQKEEQIYYTREHTYDYVGEISSNFDPKIKTVNQKAVGELIMYRDSFANALIPFLADEYEKAYFSRSVPYPFTELGEYAADTLIVERAERFLPDTACNPAVMEAPIRNGIPDNAVFCGKYRLSEKMQSHDGASLEREGALFMLEGTIEARSVKEDCRIYIRVDGKTVREAFPVTLHLEDDVSPYGYRMYFYHEEAQRNPEYEITAEIFAVSQP